MKKTIWIFITILALSVGACKQKDCDPKKIEFSIDNKVRVIDFKYESGKLVSSHIAMKDGSKTFGSSFYTYNTYGNIDLVSNTSMGTMEFYHNDENKMTSIQTKFGFIKFELDEKGQIISETNPMGKRTYEYNSEGLPVKATIYDYKGKVYTINEYFYDDKPNFMIKVFAGNSLQLLHGIPVAHAKHNVIKIIETYQQNLKYSVNGRKWKKGEADTQEITYTYNDDGYPVGQKFSDSDSMSVEYICAD